MSGDKYALLIMVVIGLAVTVIAYRNRRRRITPHRHEDDERIFRTAPRWAGRLNEKLNELKQLIGREARADERRDDKMSAAHDAILAELAAATTERAGFLVILKALQDNKDDPAKLQEIANSVSTGRQEWVAAFAENVPAPE